jgi:hypothetical protein
MTGFTKGPWRLDDTKHADLCTDGYHIVDAGDCVNSPDKGYVGFCVSGFMSDEDARLIAAAPDLLAALERMHETCKSRGDNKHWDYMRAASTALARCSASDEQP